MASAAIAELLHRYAWTYDAGDVAGAVACFVEEGTLTTVVAGEEAAVRGQAELEAFLGAARGARAERGEQPRHLVTNVVVSLEDDGAAPRVEAYMTLILTGADGARVECTGVYEDRVVETPDGWRFRSRHLRFDRAGA
ncbi:MAG TPA: nuclear transport factor 2 family protein [Baekduia sp.]|uniref:nuclear transport factor 2 family protein n=1 Tax=Baekduia sp. TaxID=2600305 RepID=UPI002D7956BE|nr:nuclear transport factor 2 family protein [Baekduia sp.]HET6506981.1 nuclear transport factor 2 family protein [Baekduia sp.]